MDLFSYCDSPVKKSKGQKRKKMAIEDEDNSGDSFGVVSNASEAGNMPEVCKQSGSNK